MQYTHRFRVNAPVDAVAAFHANPDSMAAITPPPIRVEVHRAPAHISDGEQMDFTLWVGPLPLRWLAEFDQVSPYSFRDVQRRGPFARWEHTHRFQAVTADSSDVLDTLEIELRRHPVWGPVGFAMSRSLPLLFAWRAWRTRRLLRRTHRAARRLALMLSLTAVIAAAAWWWSGQSRRT